MISSTSSLAGLRIGLISAWASRLGGGVFEAVLAQARLIADCGAEPVIFALDDAHVAEDRGRFDGAEVHIFPVSGPTQIGYAPAMLPALLAARLDLLHLHGIWMYPSAAASRWAALTGKGYVISPHGMLDPWITARGRWKKALARAGYERAGWRRASFLHALTQAEAVDIARESGRDDSVIIANAGPDPVPGVGPGRDPTLAYIGRIHPKKNLDGLIGGWRAAQKPEGAQLLLAGWGDAADVAALEAHVAAAGPSVQFLGSVYGTAKLALLARARFTILASHSEGLPMSLLDSWAAGIPTIQTTQCNLPEAIAVGAAMDCGYDPATIAPAIHRALAMPENEWTAMAQAALGLARGPFSAATIAGRWAEAYRAAIA